MSVPLDQPLLRPVLGEPDVRRIVDGALAILRDPGLRIYDPEAREAFSDAGASVDERTASVHLDQQVLADTLKHIPHVSLVDRRGGSVSLSDGRSHLAPRDGKFDYWDHKTGQTHRGTRQNVADMVRLADSLPHVDVNVAPTYAWDVPEEHVALHTMSSLFRNTTKHCLVVPHDLAEAKLATDLGKIVIGRDSLDGCSPLSIVASPTTPLTYSKDVLQIMLHAAREGVPLIPMTGPVVGATGPITLAANLVLIAAETLAGIVLAQAVHPGLPMLFGSSPNVLDMHTGAVALGGRVERVLLYGAAVQVAHYLGLPSYSPAHMHTTVLAGRSPFQAGALRMLSYVNAQLTGLDLTTGAGSMNGNSTVSPEQLVIDHELWCFARRYVEGIQVDSERLALDVLKRVGPGGHFLAEDHTVRWLRTDEVCYSPLLDPERLCADGKTIYDEAHEQVQEILGAHEPDVPAAVFHEIDRYVREKEIELSKAPARQRAQRGARGEGHR